MKKRVSRFKKRTILKIFFMIFLFFAILINFSIWMISKNKIYTEAEIDKIPKFEYGLLLGTSKYLKAGGKNKFYLERINTATKLLKKKKINKIILSGSHDKGYDEVKWMKEDLLKNGIKPNKIILDRNGNRTKTSIKNALEKKYSKFLIISQKFHLERAILLAELLNADAKGFVAGNSKNNFYTYFREFFSRFKLLFFDIF